MNIVSDAPVVLRLRELEAQRDAAVQRAREAAQAGEDLKAEVTRLTEATIEAFQAGESKRAAKLDERRQEVEVDLGKSPLYAEAMARSARQAEAQVRRYISEESKALIEAHRPACASAATDLTEALAAVPVAYAKWYAAQETTAKVLQALGRGPAEQPAQMPPQLGQLVREVRRHGDTHIPLPLPDGTPQAYIVEPEPRSAWAKFTT